MHIQFTCSYILVSVGLSVCSQFDVCPNATAPMKLSVLPSNSPVKNTQQQSLPNKGVAAAPNMTSNANSKNIEVLHFVNNYYSCNQCNVVHETESVELL